MLKAKINNLMEEQKELKDLIQVKEHQIKTNQQQLSKIQFDFNTQKEEKAYM